MKDSESYSWYIAIKKFLVKYDLPGPLELLNNPPKKFAWKSRVSKQINNYWVGFIKHRASLYASLQHLVVDNYVCGKTHHLLKSCRNAREIHWVHAKLKLATGTYILQTNRASFNQNMVDPTCLLCSFLLDCPVLAAIRNPIIDSLVEACSGLCNPANDNDILLKLIIDSSVLIDIYTHCHELSDIEF